ncbi:MAG: hypothetical protein NT067_03915 [Candidatus Diapherotrites archaeon]|nr:hypothetical protein [Candidatus Diapherotrites archaeon]
MHKKLLAAALLLLSFSCAFGCTSIGLHPNLTEKDGKIFGSVLVECDWNALAGVKVAVTVPSGETQTLVTSETGDIYIEGGEKGAYFFSVEVAEGNSNEAKVVLRGKAGITVIRDENTYFVCGEANQVEIIDNGTLYIVPAKGGCGTYTTKSDSFTVRAGGTEKKAGKMLFIEAPAEAIAGTQFTVRVLDNSRPVAGATAKILETEKTTDALGLAVFSVEKAGSFEISAELGGMAAEKKTITVLEKKKEFDVSFPEEVFPGEVFIVNVSCAGEPVQGAVVEFRKQSKPTNSEGDAFFSAQAKGAFEVFVQKENFEQFSSTVECVALEQPALELMFPSEITEGDALEALVLSGGEPVEGAKVSFNGLEKETDSSGKAVFIAPQAGSYNVVAQKEGFASGEKTASVNKPASEPLTNEAILFLSLLVFVFFICLGGAIHFFRKWRSLR